MNTNPMQNSGSHGKPLSSPISKTFGVFYLHEDLKGEAAYFVSLKDARQLKRDGKAYFVNCGKSLRLLAEREADKEEIPEAIKVRDRSAQMHGRSDETECISDQFLEGQFQALLIIKSWAFKSRHVQP